jgi:hypothetical protein
LDGVKIKANIGYTQEENQTQKKGFFQEAFFMVAAVGVYFNFIRCGGGCGHFLLFESGFAPDCNFNGLPASDYYNGLFR